MAVDPFTAMLVASTVLSVGGTIMGNSAKKKAAKANKAFYLKQLEMQQRAMRRELDVYTRESDMALGTKISSFAKAGVDFSGSALMQYAYDKAAVAREKDAIKSGARLKMDLTRARYNAEVDNMRQLDRALPMQILGTGIQSYMAYKQFKGNSDLVNQYNTMRLDQQMQSSPYSNMQILNASTVDPYTQA